MKKLTDTKPQKNGADSGTFPLGATLLVVSVFFMTFIGRTILSPLLLPIEGEMGISHAEGGSLFLIISIGLMVSMLLSGFMLQRVKHNTSIAIAAMLTGAGLFLLAASSGLFWFRVGLFILGTGSGLYLPSGIVTIT